MKNQTFASVWDALEDSPEEAANMRLRSTLMMALRSEISAWALSQKEAAVRLKISQPRLNDLLHGRINKFSLDALVNMSSYARLKVDITLISDRQTA